MVLSGSTRPRPLASDGMASASCSRLAPLVASNRIRLPLYKGRMTLFALLLVTTKRLSSPGGFPELMATISFGAVGAAALGTDPLAGTVVAAGAHAVRATTSATS